MGNLTAKMVLIPEHLLKCLDSKGFINEVKRRTSPGKSQREAYYELEDEMETYFQKRKFKDFQTFRTLQTRHNKKKP